MAQNMMKETVCLLPDVECNYYDCNVLLGSSESRSGEELSHMKEPESAKLKELINTGLAKIVQQEQAS